MSENMTSYRSSYAYKIKQGNFLQETFRLKPGITVSQHGHTNYLGKMQNFHYWKPGELSKIKFLSRMV